MLRYKNLLMSFAGLGTALCFSSSSIFIRYGLETVPSPLFGVSVGMIFCTATYGFILLMRLKRRFDAQASFSYGLEGSILLAIAGILLGFGTLSRWIAIDLAPIALVVSLSGLSIPVVLLLSPILMGRKEENVTLRVWLGAGFIITGATILTFFE